MKPKIHKSRLWLIQKYYVEKLPVAEIAKMAKVSEETIRREIKSQDL